MALEQQTLRDDLEGATVGVYGFGNTGRTLAEQLVDRVGDLIVYDDDPIDATAREKLGHDTVDWVVSPTVLQHELDYLLVSPGVPGDHPILRQAREFGVPVWGDLELSYRLMEEGTIWAVTGTNGKSTCVEFLGRLLERIHGKSAVAVCGNRGNPFLAALLEDPAPDHFVVEVSSFQVEAMDRFRPDAALLTNLGEDHLNYHQNRLEYHALKLDLLKRVPPEGPVVLPEAESDRSWLTNRDRRTFDPVSLESGPFEWDAEAGLRLGEDWIEPSAVPESLRQFPENILAVLSLLDGEESLTSDLVREGFDAFEPLPYRAEPVGSINGQTVINDSKGTNPSAVIEQLRRREGPIHLLLGGEAKKTEYDDLVDVISTGDVRSIVLAGAGSTTRALSTILEERGMTFRRIEDWESAVKETVREANDSGTVLLSPGGTSFDAFDNYKDRGEKFEEWTREVVQP